MQDHHQREDKGLARSDCVQTGLEPSVDQASPDRTRRRQPDEEGDGRSGPDPSEGEDQRQQVVAVHRQDEDCGDPVEKVDGLTDSKRSKDPPAEPRSQHRDRDEQHCARGSEVEELRQESGEQVIDPSRHAEESCREVAVQEEDRLLGLKDELGIHDQQDIDQRGSRGHNSVDERQSPVFHVHLLPPLGVTR